MPTLSYRRSLKYFVLFQFADLTRARVPEAALWMPPPELLEVEAVMGREVVTNPQHIGLGEHSELGMQALQTGLDRQV